MGITKHANDEIVVNRTFREFAEHYNIAVIPHAIGRPTGKGSVESNVDKIANRIRNMLRNRVFFSFDDLNSAIAELLDELNARPFQKREGSTCRRGVWGADGSERVPLGIGDGAADYRNG